jgi:hypothetical protein
MVQFRKEPQVKFTKLKAGLLISALTVSSFAGFGSARAQSTAYTTPFTTAVTYQNIGTGSATINLSIYAENSATVAGSVSLAALPQNAATSVFVGTVSGLNPGFSGSGVLSSDQPLAATLVQVPDNASTTKNRALSNGFSAGSPRLLFATVLKSTFGTNSKVSIQNTDSGAVDLSVKFFRLNTDGTTTLAATIPVNNLPANSAKYFDLGTMTELGASFNGSVTVDVVKTGTTTPGSAVGSVLELGYTGVNSNLALAFESVAAGANTIYMASATCNYYSGPRNVAYAIQNTSTSTPANVTVTFASTTDTGVSRVINNITIAPGGKQSIQSCGTSPASPSWPAFNGSAVITSNQPIIAIGKLTGGGFTTGFVGVAAGSAKIAMPYVRWSETRYSAGDRTRQHTDMTIQNVAATAVAGVTVKYYDSAGTLVGTHTLPSIPAGGKVNSSPFNLGTPGYEFGYVGAIGGSAVVEGPTGSLLVVVGRVSSSPTAGTFVGEDYSGIEIQ